MKSRKERYYKFALSQMIEHLDQSRTQLVIETVFVLIQKFCVHLSQQKYNLKVQTFLIL